MSRRVLGSLLLALCLSHHATAFLTTPAMGLQPRATISLSHPRSSRPTRLSPRMAADPNKDEQRALPLPLPQLSKKLPQLRLPSLSNKVKASFLTLVAVAALVLGSPLEALAAKSGGRVGGGSFRSAPSSRQYSAPSRGSYAPSPSAGQSLGGGNTVVIQRPYVGVSPFYSPFGFSPFGFGYGLAPPVYGAPAVVGGPSLSSLLLMGGVAFVGYKILTARPSDGFSGFVGDVAVSKVQVAVYCPERGPNSLLGTISRLADRCDTDDQDSISSLVSDVSLALLRREQDWVSAKVESFGVKSEDAAEDRFSQFSLKERSKIERETFNRVRGRDKADRREHEGGISDIGKPTVAVVTLILATQGRKVPEVKDAASLRKVLSSIGSDVVGNDSLMAAEVMWTPEEPWENVTPDDVVLDYPDLIPM